MKNKDLKRLKNLARYLKDSSEKAEKYVDKNYPNAGNDDELWQSCFKKAGHAEAFGIAHQILSSLILKIERGE